MEVGFLTKKGNNYYTYVNQLVLPEQVLDLKSSFKGHRYWHKYTDRQISILKDLILHLCNKHNIDYTVGLIDRLKQMNPIDAFSYYEAAKSGEVKGMLSHTNVHTGKFDIFPQEEMIDMLLSL